jgi:hypothetical protein
MTMENTAQMAPIVTNGVNVTALQETLDAVKQNTDIANFRFRAENRWLGGDHNRTTIDGFFGACEMQPHGKGPFVMDNAEPPVLLGEGAAPNPVEYVLHALAGCLTTTLVYHAAATSTCAASSACPTTFARDFTPCASRCGRKARPIPKPSPPSQNFRRSTTSFRIHCRST